MSINRLTCVSNAVVISRKIATFKSIISRLSLNFHKNVVLNCSDWSPKKAINDGARDDSLIPTLHKIVKTRVANKGNCYISLPY